MGAISAKATNRFSPPWEEREIHVPGGRLPSSPPQSHRPVDQGGQAGRSYQRELATAIELFRAGFNARAGQSAISSVAQGETQDEAYPINSTVIDLSCALFDSTGRKTTKAARP